MQVQLFTIFHHTSFLPIFFKQNSLLKEPLSAIPIDLDQFFQDQCPQATQLKNKYFEEVYLKNYTFTTQRKKFLLI